jgi:hypothetical protein
MKNNIQSYGTIIEDIEQKLKLKETHGALYKFDTVEKLQESIDQYFIHVDNQNFPVIDDSMTEEEREMVKAMQPNSKVLKVATLS